MTYATSTLPVSFFPFQAEPVMDFEADVIQILKEQPALNEEIQRLLQSPHSSNVPEVLAGACLAMNKHHLLETISLMDMDALQGVVSDDQPSAFVCSPDTEVPYYLQNFSHFPEATRTRISQNVSYGWSLVSGDTPAVTFSKT